MKPLLFLAFIAAAGLVPAHTRERSPALRDSGAKWFRAEQAPLGEVQLQPAQVSQAAPNEAPKSPSGKSVQSASPTAPASAQAKPPQPAGIRWFHPSGRRCPAWEYAPGVSASAETARVGCQRYSTRWLNAVPCVPKRGLSIPSC